MSQTAHLHRYSSIPCSRVCDPGPFTLPPGTEGLKQLILAYRTAFPDLKMTLDDIFGEGEMVAFRWSAPRHEAELLRTSSRQSSQKLPNTNLA
jgi:hypothetical protein